jgi:hypothetical protein
MCRSNRAAVRLVRALPTFVAFGLGPGALHPTKQIRTCVTAVRKGGSVKETSAEKVTLSVSSVSVRRVGRAVVEMQESGKKDLCELGAGIGSQKCVDGKAKMVRGKQSRYARSLGIDAIFRRIRPGDAQMQIYGVAAIGDDPRRKGPEDGSGSPAESEPASEEPGEAAWLPAYWRQVHAGNFVYRKLQIYQRFQERISLSRRVVGKALERARVGERLFNERLGAVPEGLLIVGLSVMMKKADEARVKELLDEYVGGRVVADDSSATAAGG